MNGVIGNRARALLGLAVVSFMLATPSETSAQSAEGTSQVAEGAAAYGNMCGRCHNPRSPIERSDRDWVTIMNHMRVRANLTGGQVRAVLAFLQATNGDPGRSPDGGATARHVDASNEPISTDPALASRGETLMMQKACIGCHVINGVGGEVGPNLSGVTTRRDAQYLRQKLLTPNFDNATSMMPNLGLTDEEIESILAFLVKLSGEDISSPEPNVP